MSNLSILELASKELASMKKDATSKFIHPRELWRLAYWKAREESAMTCVAVVDKELA